ncbi:hypothetical protein DNU06_17005 [Putridiphycobacter roseus]|uniref:Uncharacterized protein n=2 Tax=Putridiphycobacter roseus TaxID=2219161 RepID=A0A2W1N8S1_9FLAO|nr:hypothetical protein DNU06_17005 [Putridiphycobacter roseus]
MKDSSIKYVFSDSWKELYFHDSPIKNIELSIDKICVELDFAHVLKSHSGNTFGKTICGKNATLKIDGVSNLEIVGYKNPDNIEYVIPNEDLELNEIMTHGLLDDGRFTIEGFNESQLGGWCKIIFFASKIELSFNEIMESWVTIGEKEKVK